MRKVPAAPKLLAASEVPAAQKIAKILEDYQSTWPDTQKFFEFDAMAKRNRYDIYLAAGFTDSQAFELCRG